MRNWYEALVDRPLATIQFYTGLIIPASMAALLKSPPMWDLFWTICFWLTLGFLLVWLGLSAWAAKRYGGNLYYGWYEGKMYYDVNNIMVSNLIKNECVTIVTVDGGPYGPFDTIEITEKGRRQLEHYDKTRKDSDSYMDSTYNILRNLSREAVLT